MTKVVQLVQPDSKDRLIVTFRNDMIQISGVAGSADLALASVVLAKLANETLENDHAG